MHQRRAQWHGVQLSDTYSCPIHQSALSQSRNNHIRYIISTVTDNYNTSKHWECIDVNIFLVHKQMFADITSINMERKKKKDGFLHPTDICQEHANYLEIVQITSPLEFLPASSKYLELVQLCYYLYGNSNTSMSQRHKPKSVSAYSVQEIWSAVQQWK